jgi:signal peptidase
MRRQAGRALIWGGRLVLLLMTAVVAFALTVLVVLPRATHGVALTVLTGSMTPTIPAGSVVLDRPVDPGTLHVGDIATYQSVPGKAEFVTHRIMAINTKTTPTTFVFKGDANRGPDLHAVPAGAIRGKVWFHVPFLGTARDAVQSTGMRSTALVAAISALACYAGWQLMQVARAARKRPAPQQADVALSTGETEAPLWLGGDRAGATLSGIFPVRAFDGVSPRTVAGLLRADYVLVDDAHVLLRLHGSDARLQALRELLEPFAPVELAIVRTAPVALVCSPGLGMLQHA